MEVTHEIEIFHELPESADAPELLLKREPGYRVFFTNLWVALVPSFHSQLSITSAPAEFWSDVFVFSGISWWPMLESALWHLVLVTALWNVSLVWGPQAGALPRMAFDHSDVLYYSEPTFPALRAAHPVTRAQTQAKSSGKAAGPAAMKVAAEGARGAGSGATPAPPKVALGQGSQLAMMAANSTLPEMPMGATAGTHLVLPSDTLTAIAPPPDVSRAGAGSGRGGNMMEVTVVAPPPEISGIGKGRGGAGAPGLTAVGPAPSVEGAAQRNGKFDLGQSQAVAPSPQLPMHERRGGGSGAGQGFASGSGTVVVPPAPTVERAGNFAAGGGGSFSTAGTRVVPPPPSVDGIGAANGNGGRSAGTAITGGAGQVIPPPPTVTGDSSSGGAGSGRMAGIGGSGMQAVPPAPSVGGGSGSGNGGVKGFLTSLFGGGGSEPVPPAPSVEGSGAGGGRGAGLGGDGVQAVGPAPSVDGLGNGGGSGRSGSLGGGGVQAVGPAPSLGGTGGGGRRMAGLGGGLDGVGVAGGGSGSKGSGKSAGMIRQAVPPPDDANVEPEPDNVPGAHELPVRIISLAMALPNTSFFSNYEVFIAERRTKSNRTQLIKLVYESLPYQERLSNYDLKETRIYKLRVVRDHSCDETLIQMTWPEASGPKPQIASGAAPEDVKDKLPCYRTTADDYRKALSRTKQ